MIEFRTTIKPDVKEEIISSLSTLLYQIVKSVNIRTEDGSKIVLVRIYFDAREDVKRFIELMNKQQIALTRWVVYENNKIVDTRGVMQSKVSGKNQ